MKQLSLLLGVVASISTTTLAHEVVTRYRTPVNIPDLPGFVTLKCDFHIHTVFSDGAVWPTVRSEEAWRQGLDAIAITDHIEYLPHKADINKNHNRAYTLARSAGDDLNLIVVHGSEITRSMPPGHLNAIFLTNSTPLETDKWQEAVAAAHNQGAFIFWNHPGWERQTTNGLVNWYPEHTQLLEEGKLHGIEVVNGRDYYPEAHRWALDKKLTLLSNSDIHAPIGFDYLAHSDDHRPITLVFARERTPEALKEALLARRTAVYSGNMLVGEDQYLRPLFEKSLQFDRSELDFRNRKSFTVQVSNNSDISYELERVGDSAVLTLPKNLVLLARKTVLLQVGLKAGAGQAVATPEYRVTNLLVAPNEPLVTRLPLRISIAPAADK